MVQLSCVCRGTLSAIAMVLCNTFTRLKTLKTVMQYVFAKFEIYVHKYVYN